MLRRGEEIAQQQAREATTFSQLIISSLNDAAAQKKHVFDRLEELQQRAMAAREHISRLVNLP